MMKKRVFTILMTAVLALTYAAGPVCYAAASEGATYEVAEEEEENIPVQAAEEVTEEAAGKTEESLPEEKAEDSSDKGLIEQGKEIGGDLYKKMDEAVDGVDKDSIRRSIREALEQMDEMGISPSAVAENVFGIRTTYKSNEKAPENTLIRDAQNAVQKKTEGFFSALWNGFLDTIEKMITTGISVFGSSDGSVAKGGTAK